DHESAASQGGLDGAGHTCGTCGRAVADGPAEADNKRWQGGRWRQSSLGGICPAGERAAVDASPASGGSAGAGDAVEPAGAIYAEGEWTRLRNGQAPLSVGSEVAGDVVWEGAAAAFFRRDAGVGG